MAIALFQKKIKGGAAEQRIFRAENGRLGAKFLSLSWSKFTTIRKEFYNEV